ncbi:MAG: endonuclease III [Ignavibacteriae bacterium HGW-Ignavibacteriae-2]|jgi:endonuclease-3|nr:MAG: endonuclease III [Ignavibacteriae bacterium HGW-Ignavibacteriae-2]
MEKKQIQKIIDVNRLLLQQFGIPKQNSVQPSPLDMLIGTILSQNTNDKNSYQAYKNLKTKYPKWEEAHKAGRVSIEKEIRIAGLGYQKSKAIMEVLNGLNKRFGKYSLDDIIGNNDEMILTQLTAFKGIGVKTASCVLLFALGRNVCPVDTHVHRTVNRLRIVNENTPDKTFKKLNENFPPKIAHSFHTNLIRLGREICKPKSPSCGICPLFDLCHYELKNSTSTKITEQKSFMLLDNI